MSDTKTITTLTQEQLDELPKIRDKWLKICLEETTSDHAKAEEALGRAYQEAGLNPPKLCIWARDPLRQTYLSAAVTIAGDPIETAVVEAIENGTHISELALEELLGDPENPPDNELWKKRHQAAKEIGWVRLWGQYDSWLSYYDAMRYLGLEECNRIDPLMKLAENSGWVRCWTNLAILTERHSLLNRDEDHQLHCPTGPAISWPSGFAVYAWHGTRIPKEWIEEKGYLTAAMALGQENTDLRRCACEILGWKNVLKELDATVIDQHENPQIGTLLSVNMPDAPGSRFLRVLCGTGDTHALPVPNTIETATAAQEWMHPGWTIDEILALEIRT